MRLDGITIDQLWGSALAAVPLAIGVWALCRFGRFRPATRHVLWVIVLVSLVTPIAAGVLGLPRLPIDRWVAVSATSTGEAPAQPETRVGVPGIGSNADLAEDPFPWVVDRAAWEATATNPAAARMVDSLPAEAEYGSRLNRSALEVRAGTTPESIYVRGDVSDTGRKRADSFAADELRRWSAAMVDLRDAIAAIPPVPAGAWGAGILAAIAWRVVRIGLFVRAMGAGSPASGATRALVADVAAEVGLARVPLTLMLDRRVSPFVWCGLRPRLVLPQGLWNELDSAGRRAVLMHELAHLKRRDHLVVWLSQAVSVVYWWHPVVWWACRRIDEEADFACDAWVTSLRPAGRRVYAETLVVAKSYVSGPGTCRAPGLEMASRSARQLSRRLTMVMTQRTSPGLSTLGVVLAAGVAAAGMFVTPTLARTEDGKAESAPCPPTQPTAGAPQAVRVAATPVTSLVAAPIVVADAVPSVVGLVVPAPVELVVSTPVEPTSFETHMLGAAQPENPDLRELLRRIEKLERALHELRAKGAPRAGATGIGARGSAVAADAVVRAKNDVAAALVLSKQNALVRERAGAVRGIIARKQAVVATEQASKAIRQGVGRRDRQPGVSAGGRAAPRDRSPYRATDRTSPSETIAISYTLSPGKLGALTELMAREDVPILIERDEGRITVHGTKRQHEIFGAFVRMIDPESGASGRRGVPQANRTRVGGVTTPERVPEIAAAYASILDGRAKIDAERSSLEHYAQSLTTDRARLERQLGKARTDAGRLRRDLQTRLDAARESGKEGIGGFEAEVGQLRMLLERKDAEAAAVYEAAQSLDEAFATLKSRIAELEDRAAELQRQGKDIERRIRTIDGSR